MRFSCKKCKTQYTIADEKVRGKVIKVRCKRCNRLLVVRDDRPAEPPDGSDEDPAVLQDRSLEQEFESAFGGLVPSEAPPSEPEPEPTPPPAADADEQEPVWYCGLDGAEEGPLTLLDVESGIRDGSITADHFVWRDGMDDWLPIEEVPELARLLGAPAAAERVAEQRRAEERSRKRAAARERQRQREQERKQAEERERKKAEQRERKQAEERERKRAEQEEERERKKAEQREREQEEERERKKAEQRERKRAEQRERKKAEQRARKRAEQRERKEAAEPEPDEAAAEEMPLPPIEPEPDGFDGSAEALAEQLHDESLEDEHELLQRDPMAVVAKRQEMGEISQVIAMKAGVGAEKRRVWLGLLVVGLLLAALGGLAALALSQDWIGGGPGPETDEPAGSGPAGTAETPRASAAGSSSDARRVRDSLWRIEPDGGTGSGTANRPRPRLVDRKRKRKQTQQERELLAFYENQQRDEVAPRMPRGGPAAAMGIDMPGGLGLPGAGSVPLPERDKNEVVPDDRGQGMAASKLSDVQIRMVIRRHARQVKKCLERQLKRNPDIHGKLLVTARVKPDGRIQQVEIGPEKFRGTYLEECLIEEVGRWRFPSFEGETYDLTFPFALTARESY